MCIKQYKLDLFLNNTSCKIILKKLENSDLTEEEKTKLQERYDFVFQEYNTIKNYLINWLAITKETLINIQESIQKIKQNKSKNLDKKNRYIKKLNIHVLYLKRELKNYYSDCYLE